MLHETRFKPRKPHLMERGLWSSGERCAGRRPGATMHGVSREEPDDGGSAAAIAVQSLPDLARLLRQLRRRQAREHGRTELAYREIAEQTGISVPRVGAYLAGSALPPTNRFDELVLAV